MKSRLYEMIDEQMYSLFKKYSNYSGGSPRYYPTGEREGVSNPFYVDINNSRLFRLMLGTSWTYTFNPQVLMDVSILSSFNVFCNNNNVLTSQKKRYQKLIIKCISNGDYYPYSVVYYNNTDRQTIISRMLFEKK